MSYVKSTNQEYPLKCDLSLEFFQSANIEVLDIIPSKNKFIVKTLKGDKLLKKIDYKQQKLQEKIKLFDELFNWKGSVYGIINVQDKRECDYRNQEDILMVVKALANFHGVGYKFYHNYKEFRSINLLIKLKSIKTEIQFLEKMVTDLTEKKAFDKVFLENSGHYLNKMDLVIKGIEKYEYCSLLNSCDEDTICVGEFSQHDIFLDDKESCFTNFNNSSINLKVKDLCDFIGKVEKVYDNNLEITKVVLKEYENIAKLKDEEIELTMRLIEFPFEFYELIKNYYIARKNWEEENFINRLNKIVEKDEKRHLDVL